MKSFVMINSQSCSCKRKGFVYRSSKPKRGLLLLFSIFPTLYAIKTKAQGLQRETNSLFLFKANDDELFWQNNAVDYQWRSKRAARSWREHTHIDACMNINKPVNNIQQEINTQTHMFRKRAQMSTYLESHANMNIHARQTWWGEWILAARESSYANEAANKFTCQPVNA